MTWLLLTNAVGRLLPFHSIVEVETKLLPFRVSVKASPPTITFVGESEFKRGTRLLMVKLAVFDAPPPGVGFVTCIGAVPAVAMSVAGTEAVSCVELTNVVVRLLPFQLTTDPDTKLEPLTVRVKADPPAVALVGEIVLMAGVGFGGGGGGLEEPPPQPTQLAMRIPATTIRARYRLFLRGMAVSCLRRFGFAFGLRRDIT